MRAGVTGHQDLGAQSTADWVSWAIRAAIAQHGVTAGTTSLAVGADQLFAVCLVQMKLPFSVVVPCRGYEATFKTPKAIATYRSLLQLASGVKELPFAAPSEDAFLAAGLEVVEGSEIMFAVWDGEPAKGKGGTADIVSAAMRRARTVIQINPDSRTLCELRNPA